MATTAATNPAPSSTYVPINITVKTQKGDLRRPETEELGCAERLVEWILKAPERGVICQVATYAISFFLAIILMATIVGIPLVLRAIVIVTKLNERAKAAQQFEAYNLEHNQQTEALIASVNEQVTNQVVEENATQKKALQTWIDEARNAALRSPAADADTKIGDLTAVNARLTQDRDGYKQAALDNMKGLENYKATQEAATKLLQENLQKTADELSQITAELKTQSAAVDSLKTELATEKAKVAALGQEKGAEEVLKQITEKEQIVADKEKEIGELKAHRELVQKQLDDQTKLVTQMQEASKGEIAAKEQELATLNDKFIALQTQMDEQGKANAELTARLKTKEDEFEAYKATAAAASQTASNEAIAAKDTEIEALKTKLAALEKGHFEELEKVTEELTQTQEALKEAKAKLAQLQQPRNPDQSLIDLGFEKVVTLSTEEKVPVENKEATGTNNNNTAAQDQQPAPTDAVEQQNNGQAATDAGTVTGKEEAVAV